MAALLKAAGIEAWPALIGSGEKLDDDLPSPAQFSHLIALIPRENGCLWLDTTPEVAPFGLLTPALRDRKALAIPTSGAPSWRLRQRGEVADHLGQIYAWQGKRQAAIHICQLALGANNSLNDTRKRLWQAGASATPERPTLQRGARHAGFVAPAEELQKMRLTDIPALPKQQASAEFFILFSAGKAEDVQFISGSESLKGTAPALSAANYNLPAPDTGPEKIPRRGVLSCSTYTSPSCQFVLFLPATTKK